MEFIHVRFRWIIISPSRHLRQSSQAEIQFKIKLQFNHQLKLINVFTVDSCSRQIFAIHLKFLLTLPEMEHELNFCKNKLLNVCSYNLIYKWDVGSWRRIRITWIRPTESYLSRYLLSLDAAVVLDLARRGPSQQTKWNFSFFVHKNGNINSFQYSECFEQNISFFASFF